MLPVMLTEPPATASLVQREAPRNGLIELELAGGRIRVRGAADLVSLRAAVELLR